MNYKNLFFIFFGGYFNAQAPAKLAFFHDTVVNAQDLHGNSFRMDLYSMEKKDHSAMLLGQQFVKNFSQGKFPDSKMEVLPEQLPFLYEMIESDAVEKKDFPPFSSQKELVRNFIDDHLPRNMQILPGHMRLLYDTTPGQETFVFKTELGFLVRLEKISEFLAFVSEAKLSKEEGAKNTELFSKFLRTVKLLDEVNLLRGVDFTVVNMNFDELTESRLLEIQKDVNMILDFDRTFSENFFSFYKNSMVGFLNSVKNKLSGKIFDFSKGESLELFKEFHSQVLAFAKTQILERLTPGKDFGSAFENLNFEVLRTCDCCESRVLGEICISLEELAKYKDNLHTIPANFLSGIQNFSSLNDYLRSSLLPSLKGSVAQKVNDYLTAWQNEFNFKVETLFKSDKDKELFLNWIKNLTLENLRKALDLLELLKIKSEFFELDPLVKEDKALDSFIQQNLEEIFQMKIESALPAQPRDLMPYLESSVTYFNIKDLFVIEFRFDHKFSPAEYKKLVSKLKNITTILKGSLSALALSEQELNKNPGLQTSPSWPKFDFPLIFEVNRLDSEERLDRLELVANKIRNLFMENDPKNRENPYCYSDSITENFFAKQFRRVSAQVYANSRRSLENYLVGILGTTEHRSLNHNMVNRTVPLDQKRAKLIENVVLSGCWIGDELINNITNAINNAEPIELWNFNKILAVYYVLIAHHGGRVVDSRLYAGPSNLQNFINYLSQEIGKNHLHLSGIFRLKIDDPMKFTAFSDPIFEFQCMLRYQANKKLGRYFGSGYKINMICDLVLDIDKTAFYRTIVPIMSEIEKIVGDKKIQYGHFSGISNTILQGRTSMDAEEFLKAFLVELRKL